VSTAAQLLELHNSPRIPVVSRPVFSKSRYLTPPSPGPANIIFPLPKEVYQLPSVQMRYSSSSSEDEQFSPLGKNDNRFISESRNEISSPLPLSRPLSVIKKHVTESSPAAQRNQITSDTAKRTIILQER